MENTTPIVAEELNYAALADEVDCFDEESFQSPQMRKMAEDFFSEDQVRIWNICYLDSTSWYCQ